MILVHNLYHSIEQFNLNLVICNIQNQQIYIKYDYLVLLLQYFQVLHLHESHQQNAFDLIRLLLIQLCHKFHYMIIKFELLLF